MSKKKATLVPAALARPSAPAAIGDELNAFAFHLSEALRITCERDALLPPFYNGTGETFRNFESGMPSLARACESEGYIRLQPREFMRRTAGRKAALGGSGREARGVRPSQARGYDEA